MAFSIHRAPGEKEGLDFTAFFNVALLPRQSACAHMQTGFRLGLQIEDAAGGHPNEVSRSCHPQAVPRRGGLGVSGPPAGSGAILGGSTLGGGGHFEQGRSLA